MFPFFALRMLLVCQSPCRKGHSFSAYTKFEVKNKKEIILIIWKPAN